MNYQELSIEERSTIQVAFAQGFNIRKTAALINRAPSTVSRKLKRNHTNSATYQAHDAQQKRCHRHTYGRPLCKLIPSNELSEQSLKCGVTFCRLRKSLKS